MKILSAFLMITLCGFGSARADNNVQAVQSRLKEAGFYFGDATGVYDSETAAAVTRYQIRHGLAITGRLDAATAQALGVATANSEDTRPTTSSGTWRRLRNGDMQFLEKRNPAIIPSKASATASSPKPASTPPTLTSQLPPKPIDSTDRLRDYVGAFVLAGLDPQVGAELEFFAERVNYFGKPNVEREKIRRDLLAYDQRWPERRFWLAGDLNLERQPNGHLKVTFPLRYDLRSRSKHSSGKVSKTLTLRETGRDDLQIVAVNERRMK